MTRADIGPFRGGRGCERGRQARSRGGKRLCQQQLHERGGRGRAAGQRRWDLPGGGELRLGRTGSRVCGGGGCERGRQARSVVANGDGSVGVLLGNGDGTFQAAVSYGSGGASASSVAVADVNGDGKLDLVVANYCASSDCANGSVGVLLGNGDGTFQAAVPYSSGGLYTDAVVLGDLNRDGKLDLVLASEYATSSVTNGSVGVLLGNGDGTFQAVVNTSTPTPLGGIRSLALADFDGDGKLDLAVGAGNVLLLGNGDGTFQTPIVLGAGGPGIAVGDFNRDGRPDLASAALPFC